MSNRPRSLSFALYVSFVVFVAAGLIGFGAASYDPSMAKSQLESALDEFAFAKNLGPLGLFFFILVNNSLKTFIGMSAGIFLGIPSLVLLLTNGGILGLLFGLAKNQGTLPLALAGVLPHGIFEIPAILLSMSYGIWFGWRIFAKLFYGHTLHGMYRYALRRYLRIILPLLIVAAAIEAFVTLKIMEKIAS